MRGECDLFAAYENGLWVEAVERVALSQGQVKLAQIVLGSIVKSQRALDALGLE